MNRIAAFAVLLASLISMPPSAGAHPMGNFAICHYMRFEAVRGQLNLHYRLDFAEIPTLTERSQLKAEPGGQPNSATKSAYLNHQEQLLRNGLKLTINGHPAELEFQQSDCRYQPGAGGLQTLRLSFDWKTKLPADVNSVHIDYKDENYSGRTGWKEILAAPAAALLASDIQSVDRSHELTVYPPEMLPPQQSEASFQLKLAALPATETLGGSTGFLRRLTDRFVRSPGTPRDAFTQTISAQQLAPGVLIVGMAIAFLFGALHALAPGHGKAMVAAYLVGARGTARHAVILGLTVTITHTLGVFALGLVTLFASQYIVPERFYSILSIISGLTVCGVGAGLLYSRWRSMTAAQTIEHHHDHDHLHHEHTSNDHHHPHLSSEEGSLSNASNSVGHLVSHDHPFDHDHTHAPSNSNEEHHYTHSGLEHSHGPGHTHHHHLPDGPITLKSLLALGISGGIVPCPSALVVLLSAIALHRLVYGMFLITAFSFGLASVLVALGLMVVSARSWLDAFPSTGNLLRKAPIVSAAAITIIGILLVSQAIVKSVP